MMQDYEEGPCRRVSRSHGRKTVSENSNRNNQHSLRNNTSHKDKENSSKTETSEHPEWFDNSFSGTNNSGRYQLRASTPKSYGKSRRRKSSGTSSLFNTSDAMFAELDLEQMVSQSQSQAKPDPTNPDTVSVKSGKQINQDTVSLKTSKETSQDKVFARTGNQVKQIETHDGTLSESFHSSNYCSKFTNYKATQNRQHSGRKEVIIQNIITSSKDGNDTSFSFSFVDNGVSNDTVNVIRNSNKHGDKTAVVCVKDIPVDTTGVVCVKDKKVDTTAVVCVKDIPVGITAVKDIPVGITAVKNIPVENCLIDNTKSVNECKKVLSAYRLLEPSCPQSSILHDDTSPDTVRRAVGSQVMSSTQWDNRHIVSSTQLKYTQNRSHIQYRCTPYKTSSSSSSSLSSDETQTSFDITCLKDDEGIQYHCTPFIRPGTQPGPSIDTQTSEAARSMLRCTPYNRDLSTSTQSIAESQSQVNREPVKNFNTQNNRESDNSQWLSTSHYQTQTDPGTDRPSQLPATGLCNMTGLIVDTQNAAAPQDDDMSGDEDLFSDSIHHPIIDTQASQVKQTPQVKQFDSITNSLTENCNNKYTNLEKPIDTKTHSKGKCESRKRSFEDDIESIFQDSQKRRDNVKRAKNESFNTTVEDCSSKVNTTNGIAEAKDVISGSVVDTSGNRSSHVHTGALSYGARNKSHGGTLQPKTPEPTTLQQRIKNKLKENVGRVTPPAPGSLVEQLRAEVLERVQLEAQQAKTSPIHDIGPFYGLPTKVKQLFENYRGIKSLYAWQEECLSLPAIQARKNLIYSLPTSGGKTLVAEILILQELLCQKRDALLILPFVSIVQEKVRNMAQFAVDLNFHVEEYAGSKGRFPPASRRKNNTLYIATIEKAHSIVNSLIELDRIDKLGMVVVDELHMIGEGGSRGATLESTLLKIVYAAGPAQIIGMSATLSNIQDLCTFLAADTYTNDFRPVELTEYMKLSENVYKIDTAAKCPDDQIVHDRITCFQYPPEMEKTDPDHLLGLVLEIIPDKSCLVFCPTKKNCENVALMLCKLMAKYKRELSNVKKTERKTLLKELYSDAEGKICPVLQYTVQFGVAYHHSGLTVDERKLVEEAYSGGVLCMLTCTSTLAAGVNLPAKRVILRSPYVGRSFISRSQYKQMVGRAGRAGIDSSGESITICKPGDKEKVLGLLQAPLERCHSSLVYDGGRGMRTLILSTIGLKITTSTESVFKFMIGSLSRIQEKSLNIDIQELCRDSLQKLVNLGLVLQTKTLSEDPDQNVCHSLEVTELGKATVKGPIDPDYSNRLYADLQKGKESLVVASHLHLLYLVTPYDAVADVNPSWFIYFNQMSSLSANDLKVASLIGVPEVYIAKQASQQRCRQKVDEFVVKRFYLTLMLYELWNQRTVWEVAERFDQPRGFIQTLLSSAASFASCVQHFCQMMEEFWAYQDLMGNFVKRLSYCVTAELIPLVEIPGVKIGRAKLMYNAGYRTLSSVANTDIEKLVKSVQYMPRKVARQIVASAKLLLTEKAEAMMEEVEHLVSIPESSDKTPVTIETMKTPATVNMDTPATVNMQLDSQISTTNDDMK